MKALEYYLQVWTRAVDVYSHQLSILRNLKIRELAKWSDSYRSVVRGSIRVQVSRSDACVNVYRANERCDFSATQRNGKFDQVTSLVPPKKNPNTHHRNSLSNKHKRTMSGRQGGKAKPLKAPKKKEQDYDDEDLAFKEKQRADAQAKKEMAAKAKKGGPLVGGGIKKSGKK